MSEDLLPQSMLIKYMALQREVEELRSQNNKGKIFLYMVIHDLKHPTESLIDSVEQIISRFAEFQHQLKALKKLSAKHAEKSADGYSARRHIMNPSRSQSYRRGNEE